MPRYDDIRNQRRLPTPSTRPDRISRAAATHAIRLRASAEGYTHNKGFRPLPIDPDQRRKFQLGHQALTIAYAAENDVDITVDIPTGPRNLPLQDIESASVDHPLGLYMPLHGKQIMSLVLMAHEGHQNVPRWAPHALERFDGSHLHSVLETGIDPDQPEIGIVRTYDISTPYARDTPLEVAKRLERPYGSYFISVLGSLGAAQHSLTVITSRMGYTEFDRTATVLPPRDYKLPERTVNMLDVTNTEDANVRNLHLDRTRRLADEHGVATPLTQMSVDDAFLYMSHD